MAWWDSKVKSVNGNNSNSGIKSNAPAKEWWSNRYKAILAEEEFKKVKSVLPTTTAKPKSTFTPIQSIDPIKAVTNSPFAPTTFTTQKLPNLNLPVVQSKNTPEKVVLGPEKNLIFDSANRLYERVKIGTKQAVGQLQNTAGVVANKYIEGVNNSQNNPINKALYGDTFKDATNKILDPIKQFSKSSKEAGSKTFQESKKMEKEFIDKNGEATGFQWLAEQVAQNTPSFLASFGVGVIASVITKNPVLGATLGFSSGFIQQTGQSYQDAKDYGLSDKKAEDVAVLSGIATGMLETLPIFKFINKLPTANQIKGKLAINITRNITEQYLTEGGTESLQQIVDNALKKTYNENQDLFEGVKESFIVGGAMGGGVTTITETVNVANSFKEAKTVKEATDRIKEAIETPKEKRTKEQEEIVKALYEKELTPKQVKDLVINQGINETPIGVDLLNKAKLAEEQGKLIRIEGSELGQEATVSLVDQKPIEVPETIKTDTQEISKVKEAEDYINKKGVKFREDTSNDLIEEAKKYGSAKEFIQNTADNSEKMTVYRTEKGGIKRDVIKDFTFFSPSQEYIKQYLREGDSIVKYEIPKKYLVEYGDAMEYQYISDTRNPQLQDLKEIWNKANNPETQPKFRIKDDLAKAGMKITDEQEQQIIDFNKKVFGDEDVKITTQILANKNALGKYEKGMIEVVDGKADPKDTYYHEVVHKYLDIMTTREEQVKILLEARNQYNIDDFAQVEELLAEDFIQYAKSREGFTGTLKTLLDKFLIRVKKYLKFQTEIDELYNNIVSASKKSEKDTTTSIADKPGSELKPSQKPMGSGKKKVSRAYSRIVNRLTEETRADVSYNVMNIKDTVEKSMNFVAENPDKAIRIAFGIEEVPEGYNETAISIATADKALRSGNYALASQLESSRSLRQTRRGQEIVMERGRLNDDSPYYYFRELIDRRITDLGNKLKADFMNDIKLINKNTKEKPTAKEKTIAKVEQKKQKLKEILKSRDARKIASTQSFLNSIIC